MKNKSLEDELGFIADEEEDFGFIADEIPENELGFIPEPQQPTSQPQIQEQYEPLRQEQFVPGQPRLMQNISQSELTGQQDDLSKGTSPIDVRDAYGALKTAAPGFLKSAGGAVRKTEEIEFPFAQLTYNLNRYLPIGNIPAVKDLYNFWGVKDPYKDKPNQGDVLEALPEFSIIGKRRAEKGDYIKTVGKKLSDFANLTLDDIYQEYDVENANLPTRVLFGTVSSIAQQLPALATKNPTLILGAMGTQTFGTSYADARDSGLTSGKATMVGIFDGLSEIFTEYIGVGRLFKEYPSITRKILDVALADVPGEVVAELTQGLNNAINTNPDLTLNEIFKSSFVDAPLQALLQSAILGGGSKLLQRKKSKGATQAQQQAPQITPEIAPQTAQEQFQEVPPVMLQQQATAEELMQQEQAMQAPQEQPITYEEFMAQGVEQPQEAPTPESVAPSTTAPIEQTARQVIEKAGGQYKGIKEGVKGDENMVSYNDPQTGSTLMTKISEANVENVKNHIAESRNKFAQAETQQQAPQQAIEGKDIETPAEEQELVKEARKYKSAEEFVKAINKQKEKIIPFRKGAEIMDISGSINNSVSQNAPRSGKMSLRIDGNVILDGNVYSPGEKAYLYNEKYYKNPPKKLIEEIEKGIKPYIEMLIEASKKIDRNALTPKKNINYPFFGKQEITDYTYRYRNLGENKTNRERIGKKIDAISNKHNPEAIKNMAINEHIEENYVFEIGGFLHTNEKDINGLQIEAIEEYKRKGGKIGKTIIDLLLGEEESAKQLKESRGIKVKTTKQQLTDIWNKANKPAQKPKVSIIDKDIEGELLYKQAQLETFSKAGRGYRKDIETGQITETSKQESTFPDWWQPGWTKENVNRAITKYINGQKLGAREQQIIDDLVLEVKRDIENRVLKKEKPTPKEPKKKTSGLSKSIMREAIARGLTDEYGDLPSYNVRNQKGELADKIVDFIEKEPELAKKIAKLEAPEQDNMRSQEIFKALTIKAFSESDISTIEELAKSEKASEVATELGQRIQALDTGLNNDPIKVIRSVIKSRKESQEFRGREKEIKKLEAELKEVEKKLALREKQIEQLERLRKEKIKKFGEGNKLFTKETYDKAQKSLRDRLGILSSGIDPVALVDLTKIGGYYFEGGLRNFTAWSQNLIEEFGIKVKPYLRKAWDKINTDFKEQEKTILESLNTLKKTKRLTKAELVEKVLESRIAEYERRIKEEDFSAMQKPGEKISTPRIEELKRILKVIKEEYKAIKPTQERTNEQRLKAYNTRIENEIKQLEKQLETLNFNKRVRRETILDVKTMRLKEQRDKLKLSVNAAKSVGENITKNEVENIVKLAKSLNDARDQIEESGDETANNEKNVRKYWLTRKNLEDYIEGLKPISKTDTANNLTNYMRASILASPRILRNSWIYQGVPGIERAITKRLITGAFSDADFKSNIIEKLIAKMSGIKVSAEDMAFIKKQVIMNIKIYHESGYDISRMDNLGDRSRYFGERAATIKGKGVFSKVGRFVNLAPKWLAGGTDMLFASISRADTALIMSKEIASIERQQNRLPKGMTEKQRARQLLIDSYQFEPKDKNAEDIRKAGIEDAHLMNGTQTEGWSDFVIKVRNLMTYKGINFGKVIIPFAKIANVVTAEGAKTATGIGIAKSIVNMGQATLSKNKDNRKAMMRKATSDLVRYSSFTLAATLIAGMLDDDDFVGSYDMIKGKRYGLAKARGAGANYIRIAGKWIPLRYLPYINIPISAIMTARQAKKRGANPIQGYLSGMIGQLLQSPGIAYGKDMATKIGWAINSKTPEKALSALGLDGKGLVDWAKVRMIPSVLSYDIYNALFPKEQKYDFMGREIEKGTFREDKTNSIILEFNKLDNKGQAPVIADPRGVYAIELEKKLGEEHYYRYLASLKREYTEKVQRKISSSEYKRLSAKDKKETIDKIRDDKILNKLRIKNRTTK